MHQETSVENKVDVPITDKTIIKLPLHIQIAIWVAIVVFTGSAYAFINTFSKADEKNERDIITLQESKVDKVEYNRRQLIDSLENTATQRKLKLIMKKLGIEE